MGAHTECFPWERLYSNVVEILCFELEIQRAEKVSGLLALVPQSLRGSCEGKEDLGLLV
jgi:hypothetical protein